MCVEESRLMELMYPGGLLSIVSSQLFWIVYHLYLLPIDRILYRRNANRNVMVISEKVSTLLMSDVYILLLVSTSEIN